MNRWLMLGLGMAAQAASSVFLFALPFLLPELHADTGLPLSKLGLLVGAPSTGMLFALIAWGAAADRYGERSVMALGLTGAGGFLIIAAFWHRPVVLGILLALAGAAGSSVNAASGRLVLGWFPPERRGVAMGWRQTALPIGVAVSGVLVPPVAQHGGLRGAFLTLAGICLVTAAAVVVYAQDPPRPEQRVERTGNPYRRLVLWRLHGASALLVVPQFVVAAFAVEYLVTQRHFDSVGAGRLFVVASLAGAAARLLAGKWSDVVGSRLRPMRWLAYTNLVVVGLLALAVAAYPPAGVVLLLVAGVITVSTNGLSFTAVAEIAGPAWAGRALGAQNTMQNLSAAVTPAVWGALIGGYGFAWGYATTALFPLLAALTMPVDPSAGPSVDSPADPPVDPLADLPVDLPASGAEQRLPADPQHVPRHAARTGSGEEGNSLRDIYG